MDMIKILVADDDPSIRCLLVDILEVEIEGIKVLEAENGEQALELFFKEPDVALCILDVMMPVYDGYEVVETIREHSTVPIIMLTALGETKDELKGFHKGVSDYIAKPFHLPIFLARLQRLLKEERKIYKYSDMKVDLAGHVVWVKEEEILLTPQEFSLLAQLIKNEGLVLTRDQLLDKAWSYDYEGEVRTVDTHIKTLRKKLGPCGDCISTVRGSGYKLQPCL